MLPKTEQKAEAEHQLKTEFRTEEGPLLVHLHIYMESTDPGGQGEEIFFFLLARQGGINCAAVRLERSIRIAMIFHVFSCADI